MTLRILMLVVPAQDCVFIHVNLKYTYLVYGHLNVYKSSSYSTLTMSI